MKPCGHSERLLSTAPTSSRPSIWCPTSNLEILKAGMKNGSNLHNLSSPPSTRQKKVYSRPLHWEMPTSASVITSSWTTSFYMATNMIPNHWVLQATNRRWSHDDLKFIFCADSAFEAYKIMDKMSLENSVARGSVCQPSLVTRRMTCSLKDNGFVWLRLLGKCNAVISEWALCSIQVLNVLAVITIGR